MSGLITELFDFASKAITVPLEGIKRAAEFAWHEFEEIAPGPAHMLAPLVQILGNSYVIGAGVTAALGAMLLSRIKRRKLGLDAFESEEALADAIYKHLPDGHPLRVILDAMNKFTNFQKGKGFEICYLGHSDTMGCPIFLHYDPATSSFWSIMKDNQGEYLAARSSSDVPFRMAFGLPMPTDMTGSIPEIIVSSLGDRTEWHRNLQREINHYAATIITGSVARTVAIPEPQKDGAILFRSTNYAISINPWNSGENVPAYAVQAFFRKHQTEPQRDLLDPYHAHKKGKPVIFSSSEAAEKAARALILYMDYQERQGVPLGTAIQRADAMLTKIKHDLSSVVLAGFGELPHARHLAEKLDFLGEVLAGTESIFVNARRKGLNLLFEPIVSYFAFQKTRLPFTRIEGSFLASVTTQGTEQGMPVPVGNPELLRQQFMAGTLWPVDPAERARVNLPNAPLDQSDTNVFDMSDPDGLGFELLTLINQLQAHPASCAVRCTDDKIICETPDGLRFTIDSQSGNVVIDPMGFDVGSFMPPEFMGENGINHVSARMADVLNKDVITILANQLNDNWIQGCRANTNDHRGTKRPLKGLITIENFEATDGPDADWLKRKLQQYPDGTIPGISYGPVMNREGIASEHPCYQIDLGNPAVRIGDGTMPPSWEASNLRQAGGCIASLSLSIEEAAKFEHESWLADLVRSQGQAALRNNPHAKAWLELDLAKRKEIISGVTSVRETFNQLMQAGKGPRQIIVTLEGGVTVLDSNGTKHHTDIQLPTSIPVPERPQLRVLCPVTALTLDEISPLWGALPKASSYGKPRDLFIIREPLPYLTAGKGPNREVAHTNIPSGAPLAFMNLDTATTLDELLEKLRTADIYPYGGDGDFSKIAPTETGVVAHLTDYMHTHNTINNDKNPQSALHLLRQLTAEGLGAARYAKVVDDLANTMLIFQGENVPANDKKPLVRTILAGLSQAERWTRLDPPVAVLTLTTNAVITSSDGCIHGQGRCH